VRVLALRTLREFWEKHPQAEGPLRAWYDEADKASWTGPQDIRDNYRHASFLQNSRVVFNIGGNKYRLIVHVHYVDKNLPGGRVFVRFVGTHAEYDKVDAVTV